MNKKTLPVLMKEASAILNMLADSGGEITPEIEALLDKNGTELAEKIDAYFVVMQDLEARAEIARVRAEEWLAFAKSCARAVDSMKERILNAMKTLDVSEIAGHEVLFRRQLNPPKVVIDDESKIPGEYVITETVTKIDKKKLGDDLKLGVPVPGARIERTERIVAKVATAPKLTEAANV